MGVIFLAVRDKHRRQSLRRQGLIFQMCFSVIIQNSRVKLVTLRTIFFNNIVKLQFKRNVLKKNIANICWIGEVNSFTCHPTFIYFYFVLVPFHKLNQLYIYPLKSFQIKMDQQLAC